MPSVNKTRMSGNILCSANSLCNHLVYHSCITFETFKRNVSLNEISLFQNYDFISVSKRYNKNKSRLNFFVSTLSAHDESKLMSIINSNLLSVEDLGLIDLIMLNSYCYDGKSTYYWLFGGIAVSLLSTIAFFKKRMNFFFPLSLAASFSGFTSWKYYKQVRETNETNVFISHVHNLQNLCIHLHKLLRFVKETEILSTGQVSTLNIGAAMYIPINTVKKLDEFPSWKTLPQVRKCLADALLESINILLSACNTMRQFSPAWLNIKGYIFSSHSLLQQKLKIQENLNNCGSLISMKDLQLLNDTYLAVQSEFLRWIAFGFCSVNCKNVSDISRNTKTEIFHILKSTGSELSDISLKIKMQCNIKDIFSSVQEVQSPNHLVTNDSKYLSNLQTELHNIYLSILSMLLQLRSLEDQLDSSVNNVNNSPIINSFEHITQQLKILRDDLVLTVKSYDDICSNVFLVKKRDEREDVPGNVESNSEIIRPITSPPRHEIEVHVGQSNSTVNYTDDVFLTISGVNTDEQNAYKDSSWCSERKSQIPKTLFLELSTTLEPIRKKCQERERKTLEKLGLLDIEQELECKSESETYNTLKESYFEKAGTTTKILSQTNNLDLSEDLPPNFHAKKINEASLNEISTEGSSPNLNHSSLANLVAMKSQSWGVTPEECYSDD